MFLSHNWGKGQRNHELVKRIYHALSRQGVKCWFDEDKIGAGDDIMEKMSQGIDESQVFLVFVTDEYRNKVNGKNNADNCKHEFNYASLI